MSLRITDLFGIEVKKDMNERGQWVILPPPPKVLEVLSDISARAERGAPGHGAKSQKRRSKRRRLRARDRQLQRNTWRSYFEREKKHHDKPTTTEPKRKWTVPGTDSGNGTAKEDK